MLQAIATFRDRVRSSTIKNPQIPSAAILHIDIVNSSQQVQRDMLRAHRQIQSLYKRLSSICAMYDGIARELRGDAALFEFSNAESAVYAAHEIHNTIIFSNSTRMGYLNPQVRTGISYGPVIHSDNVLTGEAVIRAQRLEQLAQPGQVLFDEHLAEQLLNSNISVQHHSRQALKGFEQDSVILESTCDRKPPVSSQCRSR